jgi:hypothetical protein
MQTTRLAPKSCDVEVDQSTIAFSIDHNVPKAEVALEYPLVVYMFKACKQNQCR